MSLPAATWHKSSRSNPSGNCVLVSRSPLGIVAVRDSKDHHGPILEFSPAEWEAFIAGVKDGEFDFSASLAHAGCLTGARAEAGTRCSST
jgi:uncharacterized protein DUF397